MCAFRIPHFFDISDDTFTDATWPVGESFHGSNSHSPIQDNFPHHFRVVGSKLPRKVIVTTEVKKLVSRASIKFNPLISISDHTPAIPPPYWFIHDLYYTLFPSHRLYCTPLKNKNKIRGKYDTLYFSNKAYIVPMQHNIYVIHHTPQK